ncbi:helix-turn-helix transcriptional regulator [Rhodococcus sp. IEGM 1408]|uniref:helix-turn-helix transcriptional regulator n=1 Tax=Rhodococcus sp. IEGM 1408 TaxID=3082220 RepID=UPI0029559220|nr:LuxR C-terminal-related transcriptional regulator [Rhodococcus sp. IEGM 1408]MDV8002822.1 LuxR C-terminal-related transcriptional regulator [Rhodococcus sp. IEGM 1408]
MTASLSGDDITEGRILAAALEPIRLQARMDMVFGGPVKHRASAMEITELHGTRTRSAWNLVVHNGHGLGGKALSLRRPVSVASYFASEGITHVYDHAVRPEAIETLAAVPVMVNRSPRALLYIATRTQVNLGDRWFDSLAPIIRKLERDIAVEDEVRRRLGLMQSARSADPDGMSGAELVDIARELNELATLIDDEEVRKRIEAVGHRFSPRGPRTDSAPPTSLRPRELDVLREVARGASNNEVAESLGLLPNTVKSYMKSAMRKLHVANRVQAINAANSQGLL